MLLGLALLALSDEPVETTAVRGTRPAPETLQLGARHDGLGDHYRLWTEIPDLRADHKVLPLSIAHEIALEDQDIAELDAQRLLASWTRGEEAATLAIERADIQIDVAEDGTWDATTNGKPGSYSLGDVGPALEVLQVASAIVVILEEGFYVFSEVRVYATGFNVGYRGVVANARYDGLFPDVEAVRFRLSTDKVDGEQVKLVALPWDAEVDAPTGARGYAFGWPRTGYTELTIYAAALAPGAPVPRWPGQSRAGTIFLRSPPPTIPRYGRRTLWVGAFTGLDLGLLPARTSRNLPGTAGVRAGTFGRIGRAELDLGVWRQELALSLNAWDGTIYLGARGGAVGLEPMVLGELTVVGDLPGSVEGLFRVGAGLGFATELESTFRVARYQDSQVRVGLRIRAADVDAFTNPLLTMPVMATAVVDLRNGAWLVRPR